MTILRTTGFASTFLAIPSLLFPSLLLLFSLFFSNLFGFPNVGKIILEKNIYDSSETIRPENTQISIEASKDFTDLTTNPHSQTNKAQPSKKPSLPKKLSIEVMKRIPHPKRPFTQGLQEINGWIYESSGLYGKSYLMRYPLADAIKQGASLYPAQEKYPSPEKNRHSYPSNIRGPQSKNGSIKTQVLYEFPRFHFAEGLAVSNTSLYVLTWKSHLIYRFDMQSLVGNRVIGKNRAAQIDKISNPQLYKPQLLQLDPNVLQEGWGLTFDGEHFIVSDGSPILTFFSHFAPPSSNQKTYAKKMPVKVWMDASKGLFKTLTEKAVEDLNELEHFPYTLTGETPLAGGSYILANVWGSDFIAIIDKNGRVVGEIDCRTIAIENKKSIQKNWGVILKNTPADRDYEFALNGIAVVRHSFKKNGKATLLLTGKKWEYSYLVQLIIKE